MFWMIALEDYPVAIIFSDLKDGIVRIDVTGIFRLEGRGLFKIVLLEDQLAIDHGKGSRG